MNRYYNVGLLKILAVFHTFKVNNCLQFSNRSDFAYILQMSLLVFSVKVFTAFFGKVALYTRLVLF